MSKLIGKITVYDKIVGYMKNPEAELSELTAKEKHLLDRWQEAFTLLRNYKSTFDAAAILMKRFPGLSRAQAYRDCANAQSLFGDISATTKEGIKHLASEIVRDAIAIARVKNNESEMRAGALALAKINGVNQTDPDLPDFSLLEPHQYIFGLPESTKIALEHMIKGGRIDLTAVVNNMAKVATEVDIEKDVD